MAHTILSKSKSKSKTYSRALLAVLFLSAAAVAWQTMVHDGYRYYCENECRVITNSSGRVEINDSQGGWITRGPLSPEDPPLEE